MDIIEFLNIWIFADFENFDFDFWSILAVGGSFRPENGFLVSKICRFMYSKNSNIKILVRKPDFWCPKSSNMSTICH